ncbi:MAG: hypothetical protein AB7V36_14040 [Bacteroidales bacterium]
MKTTYYLQIASDEVSNETISDIIGVKSSYPDGAAFWNYLLNKDLDNITHIEKAVQLLVGKFELLSSCGIERADISIWVYYEYDHQCNMEFNPLDLKLLGENGITLCISCWENDNPSME